MSDDYGVVKDTSLPLSQIRDRTNTSIISSVLDIRKKQAVTRDNWLRSLECLYLAEDNDEPCGKRRRVADGSITTGASELLRRRHLNPVTGDERERYYIAVSYTWDASKEEEESGEATHGKYLIEQPRAGEPALPSEVRDGVWSRVLNYADHVGCENIWIDRECIDQQDEVAQEEAIQSMHLVYSLSKYPIALLTCTIKTVEELDLLANLIDGVVDSEDEEAVLTLLHKITSNYWWTRAWTFQEDYRASVRMKLLIPHHPDLERRKRDAIDERERPLLGEVEGEIVIRSSDFRMRATEFCLAYRKRSKDKDICDRILRTAPKYNVLLEEGSPPHGFGLISRSMSPTILSDVVSRDIGKESDRLAIMANCCGYNTRLDTNSLNSDRSSLSLTILALYLLNGEIIENDPEKPGQGTLDDNVHKYLSKQSLSSFRPPVDEALTFIKGCRFINPVLTLEGTRTVGYLWKLGKVIRCKPMKLNRFGRRSSPIMDFATDLQYRKYGKSYADMALRLTSWANDPSSPYCKRPCSPLWRWHVRMTDTIEEALLEGKTLRLGCLVDPIYGTKNEPYTAIFVGDGKDDWEDETVERYAFTASRPAKYNSSVDVDKHVSLEVAVEWPKQGVPENSSSPLPKLYIKRWLNGLCLDGLSLFDESPPQPVLFPWPRALLENTPKPIIVD
ncbi:uncharacterized protein F4807DRAFT_409436 [Annulohypoxylon truncatum]|uniref:uncharacterized protein n=1 Tax=Annulohypoxylon truncatum TaxID=327061 RepID=UPI002008A5ED|nr:uncharacterized protein F4807DRAFT_409436 [Annulohypoxylon truncatum]KAI1213866.1 hypothetical protein F4807DRAFT_409436 [Annulohypoxylon truncatum]